MGVADSLHQVWDGFRRLVALDIEVGVCEVVEIAQGAVVEFFGLYACQYHFSFEKPVDGAIAASLPYLGFKHGLRQPCEVLGDVEKCSGGSQKIAV